MRLNGGEFLLNLLVLGALTISSESVTITDESVIEQLTGLKNYINNEKAIKPLFVKFDNGTEIVVGKGEIRKTKGALSFELVCVTKSNSLTINVAFTQKVNANDDLIDDYEIESGDATLTFTNEVQIFENIVDEDGNKRFDGGDIALYSGIASGITSEFSKWSLSGTHLLIVVALSVSANTQIGNITVVNPLVLPQWIKDKIVPTARTIVTRKTETLYSKTSSTSNDCVCYLEKLSDGTLIITTGSGTLTPTEDSAIRISFDLLID